MKRLLLTGATAAALMCSAAATADVSIGISIGTPGVILATPGVVIAEEPNYYYPPIRYVQRPRVVLVPERVYSPGWVYGKWRHGKRGHWGHRDNGHHRWHQGRGHGHGHHDD